MTIAELNGFEIAAELAVRRFAERDLERQKAGQFRSQQLVRASAPQQIPLLLHPADDVRPSADDLDLRRQQQAVAGAEADADLRIEPHQLGRLQMKRRDLIRQGKMPPRRRRGRFRAGATEVLPVSDAHGWRLGRIVDPFGHHWEIGRPLN